MISNEKKRKQEEWQLVFWITSGIYVFGCIIYTIFADVNLQPWAIVENKEVDMMKMSNSKQSRSQLLEDDLVMKESF